MQKADIRKQITTARIPACLFVIYAGVFRNFPTAALTIIDSGIIADAEMASL
jgi:hypothetical protein